MLTIVTNAVLSIAVKAIDVVEVLRVRPTLRIPNTLVVVILTASRANAVWGGVVTIQADTRVALHLTPVVIYRTVLVFAW